ncbi:chemotaxis protein CheX [Nocardioides sp. LHG3406-4]|uniref:chemotaxis protein CheX n=1 Tax=Nocardioides sp. LHG3406-4 TaxID=2804575 RepID=UPI003CE87578
MTTIVVPDEALLGAVVEQVWTSMLHQPVLPWLEPWSTGRAGVSAQIAVAGDWTGVLRLWCTDSAAVSMTRALLPLTAGADPELDDIEDALGEVVNVVAGSLKGALGGTSTLGLPRVSAGSSPDLTGGAAHLTVSWHGDPVVISIVPVD